MQTTTPIFQANWNMTIPDWAEPFYPDRMRAFTDKLNNLITYTDKMIRLRIGMYSTEIKKRLFTLSFSNVLGWFPCALKSPLY